MSRTPGFLEATHQVIESSHIIDHEGKWDFISPVLWGDVELKYETNAWPSGSATAEVLGWL